MDSLNKKKRGEEENLRAFYQRLSSFLIDLKSTRGGRGEKKGGELGKRSKDHRHVEILVRL